MTASPSPSWRELLGQLTERPAERQRVAETLGVTPYTITRWVTGESEPRLQNLKRLPEVFPAYRQQFSALVQAELTPSLPILTPVLSTVSQTPVPAEFLIRLLSGYAHMRGPFRAWSLRTLVLQEAITHLDPDALGMQISLIHCVLPRPGNPVRSVCLRLSIGTPPWTGGIQHRLLFLGAESLCGWILGRGQPAVVSDLQDRAGIWPVPDTPGQGQAAACWPFLREGNLAGCLLVLSKEPTVLTTTQLDTLEVYANALALSFRDEEFMPLNQIRLYELPSAPESAEERWLATLHEYARGLRREQGYRLSEFEAEQQAFQQLEEEVLQTASPPSPPPPESALS